MHQCMWTTYSSSVQKSAYGWSLLSVSICVVQAWLHNLNPFAGEQAITVLNQFVKNANDLKMTVRAPPPQHRGVVNVMLSLSLSV